MPRATLGLFVTAVLIVVGVFVVGCSADKGVPSPSPSSPLASPSPPSPSTPAAPSGAGTTGEPTQAAGGESVRFETDDGMALEGLLFGDGEDGVVLAHMRPASMDSWFPFARVLAEEGYAALAFNFRGYGSSEGAGYAVEVDVRAAINALLARGASRVFVIGASMGGTGAIAASAGHRAVAGVITLSAPAAFEGVDAMAAIRQVDRPIMLMAAESDEPYASNARDLQEATGFAAELIILSGGRHGTDLFAEHGEALRDTILGFLADPS